MQLSPIAPLVQTATTTAPVPAAFTPAPPPPAAGALAGPAHPARPIAFEGAVDGVFRLLGAGSPTPIIDFPGTAAGQIYDIVKGSKVGPISPKGTATIQRFDPDHATFHVKAGRFGVNVDVIVDVRQISADQVRITAQGEGIPPTDILGRVVTSRTNYAEFEEVGNPTNRTRISADGAGGLVIDATIPTFGDAHLVLQRR